MSKYFAMFPLGVLLSLHVGATDNTDLGLNFINVAAAPYGAKSYPAGTDCKASNPDGSSRDVTATFQQALTDAGGSALLHNTGGVVWVPTGTYCINSNLTIPSNVILRGAYDYMPAVAAASTPPFYGAVLIATASQGNASGAPFITVGGSATVEGFTVFYPDQTLPTTSGWSPKVYPPTIRGAGNSTVQNMLLRNPYFALDFSGTSTGRHVVKNIAAEPLAMGLKVDNADDVSRVEDIHFFPFWSINNTIVRDWKNSHAIAFNIGRSDGEIFDNIFIIDYFHGMQFDNFGNGNYLGNVSNIYFDGTRVAIDISSLRTVHISNATFLGVPTQGDSDAIYNHTGTAGGNVAISNAIFDGFNSEVIWNGAGLLQMSNSDLIFENYTSVGILLEKGDAIVEGTAFPGFTTNPSIDILSVPGIGRVLFTGNSLYGHNPIVGTTGSTLVNNNL